MLFELSQYLGLSKFTSPPSMYTAELLAIFHCLTHVKSSFTEKTRGYS